MTSLVFMLDEVPEPVWKTSIGNWLSCSPAAIAAPASAISCASAWSRLPSSALTRAAVPLIRPSQRMTETGTVSPEIGKLSTAFLVSPPYSVFFFTGGIDPGAYPSGGLSPFGLEAANRARDVQRGAGLDLEVVDEPPLVHAVLGHEVDHRVGVAERDEAVGDRPVRLAHHVAVAVAVGQRRHQAGFGVVLG